MKPIDTAKKSAVVATRIMRLSRFRLNGESNRRFSFASDGGLILQVSFAFVEWTNHREQHACPQHHPEKEHEVAGALQFYSSIRILDRKIDHGGELIAKGDRQQVRAHDERFELHWSLGVGKFKMRRRNKRFARSQHHKGPNLPDHIRSRATVDPHL